MSISSNAGQACMLACKAAAAVRLDGIHKTYGTVRALSGLDVTLAAGEIHAFLGANGAGKTTAIGIMTGLRRADLGAVEVLGGDPQDVAVRRRIGLTPQESGFDVVLSGDNSVPHLLSDEEILLALRGMYACLRPGGGCIITIRDYDREERGQGIVKPYGIREEDGKRYLIWQIWDFEGQQYALSMYFIEDDKASGTAKTHVMRSRYYAIGPGRLLVLMERAGFDDVKRLDGVFIQPVLVGTKTSALPS